MEDKSRVGQRHECDKRFMAADTPSGGGTRLSTKIPLAFCPRANTATAAATATTTTTTTALPPIISQDKQQQPQEFVTAFDATIASSNMDFNKSDNSVTLLSTQEGMGEGVEEDYSQFASIEIQSPIVVSTLSKRRTPQRQSIFTNNDDDDDREHSRTADENDYTNSENDIEESRRGNGLSVRRTNSTQQQLDNTDNHNNDDNYDEYDNTSSYTNLIQYYILRSMRKCCKPRTRPPCHAYACYCYNNNNGQDGSNNANNTIVQKICRITIILFMIITITFVCLDLLILHDYLHGWLDTLLAWLTVNPYSGGVVFIGIFIIGSFRGHLSSRLGHQILWPWSFPFYPK
jgi:hypothetical protein